jgi:hypothetical protein
VKRGSPDFVALLRLAEESGQPLRYTLSLKGAGLLLGLPAGSAVRHRFNTIYLASHCPNRRHSLLRSHTHRNLSPVLQLAGARGQIQAPLFTPAGVKRGGGVKGGKARFNHNQQNKKEERFFINLTVIFLSVLQNPFFQIFWLEHERHRAV